MLSLTKKSEASSGEPRWHPNFGNAARLPDTKVVRTTFFINTASIVLVLGLLMWLGYSEYQIFNLGDQINIAQQQIDQNTKQNNEALRLTKIFKDEEGKLAAAENFLGTAVSPVEYINLLGTSLPREISIEYAEYVGRPIDPKTSKVQTFVLRGIVAGTRDEASGSASRYVDVLLNHPRFKTIFDPITLEKLTPEGSSGFMAFEVFLKTKAK